MRLRQLAERRVSSAASGPSLRALSAQEVKQVAGAIYYGIDWKNPFPSPYPSPFPYPLPDLSTV